MSTRMKGPVDIDGLLRYVAGESDADEAFQVERWLGASRANVAFLESLRRGLNEGAATIVVDVRRGMERLGERIDRASVSHPAAPAYPDRLGHEVPGMTGSRWRGTLGVWSAMLGVLVAALGGVVLWHQRAEVRDHIPQAAIVYTTANGQRANITLPDGSTVSLNVGSRLSVPADFAAGDRTLTLYGEGLFQVTHRHGSPFSVVIGSTTVRVLGTTFVVRSYSSDTAALVAVREGKVAVGSVVVGARQAALVREGGEIRLLSADPGQFTFASGVLTLGLIPLKGAVAELNRWYDADIRVTDPMLAARRLQGTFTAGSLSDLASILEFTLDARVVRDGRTLILSPR